MRITYRTLASLIDKMSDEQKDCDVTVEDSYADECYPATLRIANNDSLDDGHPVIFLPQIELQERNDDVEYIAKRIGLTL